MTFRTDRAKVLGLGSAKSGADVDVLAPPVC